MKRVVFLFAIVFFVVSCASSQEKNEKSPFEKEIKSIKENVKGKELAVVVKTFDMQEQYAEESEEFIDEQLLSMIKKLPKHKLDTFKESPNKEVTASDGKSMLHLKNNYPSGNLVFVLIESGDIVHKEVFPFNSEKKVEFEPGNYEFFVLIDRKFNNNIFVFHSNLNMMSGKIYLGEFNIKSEFNKSGSCKAGSISDDDMCITAEFKILDNCPAGFHLVENLCCEEGFNFIMDGKCSRYSNSVETVVCPAGYHEAGQGRCCPKGFELIDGKCQIPKAQK